MRLSALLIRFGVFVLAAAISAIAARGTVAIVEDRSEAAVQSAFLDQGQTWASVLADGLQVIIEGEAPTEAVRFRAISLAGSIVDASRVIDNLRVREAGGIAPPDFAIEILRNDSGVSLIGLVPATTDRAAVAEQIADLAGGLPVTDLLQTADYPVPEGWQAAIGFALRALRELPRSKISVTADRVSITAISDSEAQKEEIERLLSRIVPRGVALSLEVTAPRPVITPFVTRFSLDAEGARFDACAADTLVAERQILAAAAAAGADTKAGCTLGLGVPSATWGEAVALAITAVKDLGGGTVTIADADISLVAREGVEPGLFDRVVGDLANALPDLFVLDALRPVAAVGDDAGTPEFSITLSPEGQVQIRGRVPDDLIDTTAANFAAARFGDANLTVGTRVAEGLPAGWSIRILSAIEAMSELKSGSVVVQPDTMVVRGISEDPQAGARISRLLIEKLGEATDLDIDITYIEVVEPVTEAPTPEGCVAQVTAVTDATKITFDPGSATLTAAAGPVIDQIAAILAGCVDMPIEIAGYTDSQGREEMNQRLSQERAEAVLSALLSRRVPVGSYTATGYGEASPIADNETEPGREANRRIEFRVMAPAADGGVDQILDAMEASAADRAEQATAAGGGAAEGEPDPALAGQTADPAIAAAIDPDLRPEARPVAAAEDAADE